MAAGIIFIVIIQRKISLGKLGQFGLEAAKSILATCMWVWLFFDSLLAHRHNDSRYDETRPRVFRSIIASILLW
jgi:hypothetical protein